MTATATQTATAPKTTANVFATRDQLVLEHLDLVKAITGRVRRGLAVHVDSDDLQNAGMMGLIDAAAKYEGGKEIPFTAYAKHRIRGAILDSLRQVDWASRQARRQYKRVDAVTQDLTGKLQRVPTQEEVAAAMGFDAQQWQNLMGEYRRMGQATSQANHQEGDEAPAKEIPASADVSPELMCARTEMRKRISSAVGSLPERYRQVIRLYYEGDMSMKEIGGMLGVNESRVSQIHKTALAKMQVILTGHGISETAAFC